jgi:uncharacterized protein involved in tellurium resistance
VRNATRLGDSSIILELNGRKWQLYRELVEQPFIFPDVEDWVEVDGFLFKTNMKKFQVATELVSMDWVNFYLILFPLVIGFSLMH